MPVSQHEMALSRDRLPIYLRLYVHHLVSLLLDRRWNRARAVTRLKFIFLSPHFMQKFILNHCQRSSFDLLGILFNALYFHYYSFNMFIRPTVLFPKSSLASPYRRTSFLGVWFSRMFHHSKGAHALGDEILKKVHDFVPIDGSQHCHRHHHWKSSTDEQYTTTSDII